MALSDEVISPSDKAALQTHASQAPTERLTLEEAYVNRSLMVAVGLLPPIVQPEVSVFGRRTE